MNTNLVIRNTIVGLVAGTIGHSTFASGDPLLSMVNDAPVGNPSTDILLQVLTNRESVQNHSEEKKDVVISHSHFESTNIASGQGSMSGGLIESEGLNDEGKFEAVVEQDFSSFNTRTPYQETQIDLSQINGLTGNVNIASGQGTMAGMKIKGKVKQTF